VECVRKGEIYCRLSADLLSYEGHPPFAKGLDAGKILMYLDFYGFREKPFNLTPDPRFIFLSKSHKEAFAHILYGILNRVGFILLTGEVGSGKTTILRAILAQLDADPYRTALIFNPCLSPAELLQNINREFGISSSSADQASLLNALNSFLLEQNAAGRTVVLVIDEAQNLDEPVLEQIRLISNLETEKEKLIQIILSGQPELLEILNRRELRQLSQRITVRYHLEPMDFSDTVEYVNHRIRVAGGGGRGRIIFSHKALKRVHNYSGGLPRLINAACDRALLAGYTKDAPGISSRIAGAGIKDMKRNPVPRLWRRPFVQIPAFVLVAAFLGAGVYFMRHGFFGSFQAYQPLQVETRAIPKESSDSGGEGFFPALVVELGKVPEGESARMAFNTLADIWKVPPIPENSALDLNDFDPMEREAQKRRLGLYQFSGNLGALLRMDYPAALELALPGIPGKRFLSLVGMEKEQLLVDSPMGDRKSFSFGDVERYWSGRGFLLWKDSLNLLGKTWPGTKGEPVKELQRLLKKAGDYPGSPTGHYDDGTQAAVRKFQESKGIEQDGIAGEQTLMTLYRSIDHFEGPRLQGGSK
jgi:general secretion pathway protein A